MKYNWFTMCWFLVYSFHSVIYIYIYVYIFSFSYYFPWWFVMQHFENDKNLKSIFTAIKNISKLKLHWNSLQILNCLRRLEVSRFPPESSRQWYFSPRYARHVLSLSNFVMMSLRSATLVYNNHNYICITEWLCCTPETNTP